MMRTHDTTGTEFVPLPPADPPVELSNSSPSQLNTSGFWAKTSIELRDPLVTIMDQIALVKNGLAGAVNFDQMRALETAYTGLDELRGRLDDLLIANELESGVYDTSRQSCNLAEIMDQARIKLSQVAKVSDVVLDFQTLSHLPRVYCDLQKACHVLIRLGHHAIRSCSHRGIVRFWARYDPAANHVRVGVTDNGKGMAAERSARLQKLFNDPLAVSHTESDTLELSLSIASRFCGLNLGELHVDSEPGLGAIFWFDLPVAGSPEVFPRWLKLQRRQRCHIHLLRLDLDPNLSDASRRDCEMLLTILVQNDDLLVQVGANCWLLASACETLDAEGRERVARDELENLAAVGATGQNSKITISVQASWNNVCPSDVIEHDYFQLLGRPPAESLN